MATKKLLELTPIVIPTTGTNFYLVENGQSYQGSINQIANLMISNYSLTTGAGGSSTTVNNFSGAGGITGISVTGSKSITGLASFQGIGGTNVILNGNTISISGGSSSSNSNIVYTTGNQAIGGFKTFNNFIVLESNIQLGLDSDPDLGGFYIYDNGSSQEQIKMGNSSLNNNTINFQNISKFIYSDGITDNDVIHLANKTLLNPSVSLDWNNKVLSGNWQVATSSIPASSTSAGTKGMMAISGNKLLIATGNSQWGFINISSY